MLDNNNTTTNYVCYVMAGCIVVEQKTLCVCWLVGWLVCNIRETLRKWLEKRRKK